MNIDFSRIEMFTDIAHTQCVVTDVRKQFADIIYNLGQGIAAHALALKIFNSKGPEFYDETECAMITEYSRHCTPAFIEAIQTVTAKQ